MDLFLNIKTFVKFKVDRSTFFWVMVVIIVDRSTLNVYPSIKIKGTRYKEVYEPILDVGGCIEKVDASTKIMK